MRRAFIRGTQPWAYTYDPGKGVVVYPILPLVHHRMVLLISQISGLDAGILQHQVWKGSLCSPRRPGIFKSKEALLL